MVYYVIFVVIILFSIFMRTYMQIKLNDYFDVKTKISGFEACKNVLDETKKKDVYIVLTKEDVFNYYDISNNAVKLSNETFNGEDIVNVCLSLLIGNEVLSDDKFLNLRNKLFKIMNFIIRICYVLVLIGLFIGKDQFCYASIIIFVIIFIYQVINYLLINKIINNSDFKLIEELDKKECNNVLNIIKYKEFSLFIDSVFNIFKH